MKHGLLLVAVGVGLAVAACGSSKKDSEQPQGYQQQPPPGYQQQPPPTYQPQPAPAPAPAPAPTPAATTPAPATSGSAATPTAIPGVMKNPDGTCSIQIPGGQPMAGPCPPGI